MDPVDLFFRAVGVFYALAGLAVTRAMLMDGLLDKALAAITLKAEQPKERIRRGLLGTGAVVTGASGAALALLSFWALPLFLLNVAIQAGWLWWARTAFVPEDEEEAQGRRRSLNTAAIYAVAALGVAWLWRDGRLGPWNDAVAAAGIAAVAAGLGFWLLRHSLWNPASTFSFASSGDDGEAETAPRRVIIDPSRWCWPLINADTQARFNHLTWLDDELAWRVEHWDDLFQNAFDPDDDRAGPAFASPQEEAGYEAEALAIAEALKAAYGAENVSFGPGWTDADEPDA